LGPRSLTEAEVEALLASDAVAYLGTLGKDGFPQVTPIWFVWDGGAFYMTSLTEKAHVGRLERDPRASICVEVEEPERRDGERPNRSVRATGPAELFTDIDGEWTRRITEKYVRGPGQAEMTARRAGQERIVIRLQPVRFIALSSV
jgi:PPOX class probable F420-dependent enzyme